MTAKTELPTPRRLAEARRKGDLPRSRVLAAAITALGAFSAFTFAMPHSARSLVQYAGAAVADAASGASDLEVARARALEALAQVALPVLISAVLAALAGHVLQTGFVLTPRAVAPQLSRLSPRNGLRRLFSKQSLGEAFRAVAVGACVILLAAWSLRAGVRTLSQLPAQAAASAFALSGALAQTVAVRVAAALAVLGGLDLLWQRRAHRKRLMMTRDEVRRELKETEGDPFVKARRKALHRAASQGTAARGVHKATVVVVNPTHLAVALRYEPSEASAPTIVAKGREDEAARLRHLARILRVPIVRDVPLARALFPFDVGEEIPEELYEAAAVVLRKVYAMGAPPAEAAAPARSRR